MNILVIEPSCSGHHFALYGKLVVRALLNEGHKIIFLTTREAAADTAFDEIRTETLGREDQFKVRYMRNVGPPPSISSYRLLKHQLYTHLSIRNACKLISNEIWLDHAILINLDHIDKILPILGTPFGTTPFSGILMSIKFHVNKLALGPSSRSDFIFSRLFRMMNNIARLKRIGIVDESFLEYCKTFGLNASKIVYLPDPVVMQKKIARTEARSRLNIPQRSKTLLIYGSITRRKGVEDAVSAVLRSKNNDMSILISGSFDREIREFLSSATCKELSAAGRIFTFDKFHSKEEESVAFSASDVVWLGYKPGFVGSSGVLYQAGEYSLPVIAQNTGLVSWLVQKHDVGLVCNPSDVGETSAALETAFGDREWMLSKGSNCRALAEAHSPERFCVKLLELIDQT